MTPEDWKAKAEEAWEGQDWTEAAQEYHRNDAHKPRTSRWYVYDRTQLDGAPQPTVEALMYSLRERGTKALEEADTKRRLSSLSDRQVIEVGNRLQKLKPEIARAWSAAEVATLFQARSG